MQVGKLVAAALCALSVLAAGISTPAFGYTTYAYMTSKNATSGNNRLSDARNYSGGVAPTDNYQNTILRFFLDEQTACNDLGEDFGIRELQVTQGAKSGTLTGDALSLGLGGISVDAKQSDHCVTLRVDCAVNARVNGVVPFNAVSANDTIRFGGLISSCSNDTVALQYTFKGNGTKTIAGGMRLTTKTGVGTGQRQQVFSGGTTIIASDVYLPSILVETGARVVITNGARMEVWDTDKSNGHSFLRACTLDVADGSFVNNGIFCTAQSGTATAPSVINVYGNGVVDTGSGGMRFANNYKTEVNVCTGGVFYWRTKDNSVFCENGETHFSVLGGRVIAGNDRDGKDILKLYCNRSRARADAFGTSSFHVGAGGEILFTGFRSYASAAYADEELLISFDDGHLVFPTGADIFAFGGTAKPEAYMCHVRAGGLTVDVRENTVTWKRVALRGTDVDGGTDGGLVKKGSGKLTVDVPMTFTGTTVVQAGELALSATNAFASAISLRPQSVLSFNDGTVLALAGLTAGDGIVRLTSGQRLQLASAPSVTGTLAFDFPAATAGAYTLLTLADGVAFPDGFAGTCALLKPVAGMSCTFAVNGQSLVATVAAGTAPEAPALAASENDRAYLTSGTTDVAAFSDAVTYAFNGGTLRYTGSAPVTLADEALYLQGAGTLTLAEDAGEVTLENPFQYAETPESTSTFALGASTEKADAAGFVLAGDWSASYPYDT